MHRLIVHLASIGFYIWGAMYCYEVGLNVLRLGLQEYEEYYAHNLEADRIAFARAAMQSSVTATDLAREMRMNNPVDASLGQIQQNITEQREIYIESMQRLDAERTRFAERSHERKANLETAYREAYVPVAVVGGVMWYLLTLPLCGLVVSILSLLPRGDDTQDLRPIKTVKG